MDWKANDLVRMASSRIRSDMAREGYVWNELSNAPALNRQLTLQWLIEHGLLDTQKLCEVLGVEWGKFFEDTEATN